MCVLGSPAEAKSLPVTYKFHHEVGQEFLESEHARLTLGDIFEAGSVAAKSVGQDCPYKAILEKLGASTWEETGSYCTQLGKSGRLIAIW